MNTENTQAGMTPASTNTDTHTSVIGTNEFSSAVPSIVDNSIPTITPLAPSDQTQGESLSQFFERPVIIDTMDWGSASASRQIYPWALWASNAAVERKLANYTYFRGNLHLRFEVNATPFHYGMLAVDYTPNMSSNYDNNGIIGGADKPIDALWQHVKVLIQPSYNGVYEMVVPMLWKSHKFNMLSQAFNTLGRLQYFPISNLSMSNTTVISDVTIRTYAWVSDIVLECPTINSNIRNDPTYTFVAALPAMTPPLLIRSVAEDEIIEQSGFFARASDIIRGGGEVLKVAAKLSDKAGDMAKYLGFSRPEPIATYTKTLSVQHDFAEVEGDDNVTTLSLYPNSQRPLAFPNDGEGVDPMLLSELVTRDGYLGKLVWTTSTSRDTALIQLPISPSVVSSLATATAGDFNRFHPLYHFSGPFRYWRGTLIVTLRVVCSAQHSGKLKIFYDPYINPGATATALDDPQNTTRIYIMDIGLEQEKEFVVGWCNQNNILPIDNNGLPISFTDATLNKYPISNGFLSVYTASKLVAPLASQGIEIVVSIRAGDDYQVGAFNNIYNTRYQIIEQSGIFRRMPDKVESIVMSPSLGITPDMSEMFNEPIVSYRPILKRFQVELDSNGAINTVASEVGKSGTITTTLPVYPALRGQSKVATGCNRGHDLYLHHVSACFLAQRGSVKNKVVINNNASDNAGTSAANQHPSPETFIAYSRTPVEAASTTTISFNVGLSAPNASAIIPASTAGGFNLYEKLSFDSTGVAWKDYPFYPYFAGPRFTPYRPEFTSSTVKCFFPYRYISMFRKPLMPDCTHAYVMVAAGDDYDVYGYLHTPRTTIALGGQIAQPAYPAFVV